MKNLKYVKNPTLIKSSLVNTLITSFCLLLIISCTSKEDETSAAKFDITELSISNSSGEIPKKGEALKIRITIKNTGGTSGKAILVPLVSSSRFSDFKNIKLKEVEHNIEAGKTEIITIEVGPFIYDESANKHFALGRGEYYISSILVNGESENEFSGKIFNIQSSNALFVPVMVDPEYLKKIDWNDGIDSYLKMAFTRKVELYDNNGNYTEFSNGLDEMMDINHIFYPIETQNVSEHPQEGGTCEKAIALAKEKLGLINDWKGPVGTQTENHGFDYLMVLSSDSFGGVTCGWINVQISGVFDYDLSVNRSQIILIHESSHIFGSPHCDPLQGYVMCSGEKHRKYLNEGIYVYNIDSKNQMSNRFD